MPEGFIGWSKELTSLDPPKVVAGSAAGVRSFLAAIGIESRVMAPVT